jgi:hypothetical protein
MFAEGQKQFLLSRLTAATATKNVNNVTKNLSVER